MTRLINRFTLIIALILGICTAIGVHAQIAANIPQQRVISFDNPFANTVVEREEVKANPVNSNTPPGDENPPYSQYKLVNFLPEVFKQPEVMTAQISVYPTAYFPEYGFEGELKSLTQLLSSRRDLKSMESLPYIPIEASSQAFHALEKYIEAKNISGIRYLTYYTFDVRPLSAFDIFYTFQGLSNDGKYYIAATFPIKTGFLPETINNDSLNYDAFANTYPEYIARIINSLNNPKKDFIPALSEIDKMMESIKI